MVIHCDNTGVVVIVNSGYSKVLRSCTCCDAYSSFRHTSAYRYGRCMSNNGWADAISHKLLSGFLVMKSEEVQLMVLLLPHLVCLHILSSFVSAKLAHSWSTKQDTLGLKSCTLKDQFADTCEGQISERRWQFNWTVMEQHEDYLTVY